MKNDVLEFLASDNEKPQEKFNKALRLYRSSKNNDESQVRFMNRLGYSPARLEDLLYQLKTLHGITDVELATARNKGKKKDAPQPPKGEQNNAPEETEGSEQNTEGPEEVEKTTQEHTGDESEAKVLDDIDVEAETSEASKDDQENDSEDQDKTSEEKEEAPVEDQDKTPEKEEEPKQEVPEAIKKLDGFDVEAADYNTIKSFAAELGDAIKKTPKDQKGATLKAFITEAKKKHSKA